MKQIRKPRAVLISDIHFTPSTLELATKALIQAQDKATELQVPLLICGDTLDGKAVIRGECANRLIDLLGARQDPHTILLVGNHDLINEKSKEHSLNFLKPYCGVIEEPVEYLGMHFIPYQSDSEMLKVHLDTIPTGSTIIAHQGLQTAFMGHYVQDKTSISPEAFKRFRTISGHYHRHQEIKCGETGLFTYIGTPYTTTFAEAHDGPKGFQILFEDGHLELVPTNLRKHIIIEKTIEDLYSGLPDLTPEDIIWLKIAGRRSELEKLKKSEIGLLLLGHSSFKLDLIYTDIPELEVEIEQLTDDVILDILIDSLDESEGQKTYLKNLWRGLIA